MNLRGGTTFAAGALFAAGAFLLMGAAQTAAHLRLFLSGPVRIEGHPTPQQMQRVVEGAPFVVPAGKLFVVTGLGSNGHDFAPGPGPNKHVRVSFNGISVLEAMIYEWQGGGSYAGGGPTIPPVPAGLTAPAGVTITATDDSVDAGVVLGYLVDA